MSLFHVIFQRLRQAFVLVTALACLFLSACDTAKKVFAVVKDPEVQVGDSSDQTSTLDAVFFAQRNANINTLGEEVPISVLVIEMLGDSAFKSSEIFEFLDDPKAALGDQFIAAAEHTVPPGEFLTLSALELNEATKFVGIVGLFSEVEDAQWRDFAPVEPSGKIYVMTVEIDKGRIAMELEER